MADSYRDPMPEAAVSRMVRTTVGASPAPRQPTQIEGLSRDLAQVANKLNLFNDNVEQKLETFSPSEVNSAGERDLTMKQDASPPDGTMAALYLQSRRLQHEVERYGALWERLATII